MWYVAFTLGLLGSLHCLGMCGPLAIAAASGHGCISLRDKFSATLQYNIGRTLTYTALGVLFGLIGGLAYLASFQKVISISMGILLIGAFLMSINVESKINASQLGKSLHHKVRTLLEKVLTKTANHSPLSIGLVNGLLPCGLVYLALAGAMTSGSLISGMLFMTLFGLGTMPMMITLALGYGTIPLHWRVRLKQVVPYVSLAFGGYLIYRGIVVNAPQDLDFWIAINNPVMCH